MATIQTTIQIIDRVTAPVYNMQNAVDGLCSSFGRIDDAMQLDTSGIDSAESHVQGLNDVYDQTERTINDNTEQQERFNESLKNGANNSNKLLSSVKKMAAAYLSVQSIKAVVDLSDTATLTEARLNLIVDDGGSVQELQNKIFASAQASRAAYQTTADAVSKLGLQASNAFTGNDELIAFAEQLNKTFVVAGTSAQGVESVMLQLTQAMAAGKLQGEELNAVLDNAQPIVANIQKYLEEVQGIDATNIKKLASEGVLTAETIKNAMFYAAEETNAAFDSIPYTFGQIWTSIQNQGLKAFQPILRKINEIANTDKFNKLVEGVTNTLGVVAAVVTGIFDAVVAVGSFMYDNWSTIEPIIWGVVTAMIAWKVITLAHAVAVGIAAAAEAGYTGIKGIAIGVTAGLTGATVAATAAQYGMNTALYACPIVWIIAAIIALIVLFVIFTEEITGAIWWLGALFKNVGLWIANCGIAAWEVIKNIGLWFANLGLSIWTVIKNIGLWFGNLGQAIWAVIQNVGFWFANLFLGIVATVKAVATNIGIAFSNGWITVQVGFWSMVNVIMQGLKSIAETANSVLGWMGVNIDTSGLDFAANKIDELNAKKQDYVDVGAAWNDANSTYAYKNVGDAFGTYDYGSVADAWNTNDIDWSKVGEGFNTFDTFEDGWGSDAYAAGAEVGANISDWIDNNLSMGALLDKFGMTSPDGTDAYDLAGTDASQYLSDISGDTGAIKDSVTLSSENLKYLRDIAERDVINRFTTAEVKVEFGGITNNVSSETDLDGMVTYISDRVAEELEVVAEGVHE